MYLIFKLLCKIIKIHQTENKVFFKNEYFYLDFRIPRKLIIRLLLKANIFFNHKLIFKFTFQWQSFHDIINGTI